MKKPVSRQRKWQLAQIAKGRCSKCPRKLFTSDLCKMHRDDYNLRQKNRRMALDKHG